MFRFYMIVCLLVSCFISTNALAIFCPKSFKSVNIGDSIDIVQQTCGEPDSQKTYTQQKVSSEEWTYYVRTNLKSNATSKMKVVLQNDKVINIHIDNTNPSQPTNGNLYAPTSTQTQGQDVSSTTACGGLVAIGNSADSVKQACGSPVNQQKNYDPSGDVQITEYTYQGVPNTTLIFQDGKLASRQQN